MKRSLLPISIVFAALAASCNGNKAETSQGDSLQVDTPAFVNHADDNPANDKVQLNSDSAVVNTEKEQGAVSKMGEATTKGSTEKGTTENLSKGKMEEVKHGSDNQAKLDSIKAAKQRQRGN